MIPNPHLLIPPNPVRVVGGPHDGEYWDTRATGAERLHPEGSYRRTETGYLWRPALVALLDVLEPHGFVVQPFRGPVPNTTYLYRFADCAVLGLRATPEGWTVVGVDGAGEVLEATAVPSAEALQAWLLTALCAPAAVPA